MELAEMLELELNTWGFGQSEPFSLTRSGQPGIVLGGSFTGLKDVGDSVIQSSAAALNASRVIHSGGGSLAMESPPAVPAVDLMRELPKILVVVCTCGGQLSQMVEPQKIAQQLKNDPLVNRVEFLEQTCTANGWERLVQLVEMSKPNRVLIGACLPYVYQRKIKELSRQVGLDAVLMEVVDLNSECGMRNAELKDKQLFLRNVLSALEMGIAKLKWAEPGPVATVPIIQKALVIGGGIGGMTAALAIADHGFNVDLVEASDHLGGNLTWLQRTLEGHATNTRVTPQIRCWRISGPRWKNIPTSASTPKPR
jgi:heterodisulfide reductase subunit A